DGEEHARAVLREAQRAAVGDGIFLAETGRGGVGEHGCGGLAIPAVELPLGWFAGDVVPVAEEDELHLTLIPGEADVFDLAVDPRARLARPCPNPAMPAPLPRARIASPDRRAFSCRTPGPRSPFRPSAQASYPSWPCPSPPCSGKSKRPATCYRPRTQW